MGIFDLTGPAFLAMYVPILAGAWLVSYFVRSRIKPGLEASASVPDVTSVEAAYLAGGASQAFAALLASLAQRKLITFDAPSRSVTAAGEIPTLDDPYERRLLGLIGKRSPKLTNIEEEGESLFAPLRVHLTSLGLLVPDDRRGVRQAVIVALMGVALAIGAIKLVIGISRDRPVGILLALLVIGVVGVLNLVRDMPERSSLGDEVLKRLRHQSAGLETSTSRRPDRLAPNDLALAVALYGPSLITVGPVAVLAQSLQAPRETKSSMFSGSSCGSSSCGSSCSGGCGGGGCGGCGS